MEGIDYLYISCATTVCLLVFLYVWRFKWCQRRILEAASKLPHPMALPLLGNTYMALGGIVEITKFVNQLATNYGDLFCVWLGPVPLFIASNPEDLKIILTSSKTLEKDDGYKFLKPFLGNGLITCPAKLWKRNRRALNPVFHPRNLENFLPILNKINKRLVDKFSELDGKSEVDVYGDVLMCSAESVCRTVLGINMEIFDTAISKYHTSFMKRISRLLMFRFTKFWLAIDSIFYFFHGKDMKELNAIIEMLIYDLNEDLRSNNRKTVKNKCYDLNIKQEDEDNMLMDDDELDPRNFREILMDLIESDPTFTEEDMKYEIITTLAPGTDVYSNTLCFCLLSLANLQDVQEKLFDEIQLVCGDSDKDVTLDDLKRMPYLEGVIKETLRRYRPNPFIARKVTEDIKLTTCTIPAGGRIIININGVHMNPTVYPDPEKFDPERFSPENIAKRHPYCFLPFSAGPRNCIGKPYTMMALKLSVIQILKKFQLSTSLKLKDIVYEIEISLGSKDGYPIKFKLRK